MKSMKSKPSINGIASSKSRYGIKLSHWMCIEGYIRSAIGSIASDIVHLLLLFYAKPLTLYCHSATKSSVDKISYCFLCNDWQSLIMKLREMNNAFDWSQLHLTIDSVAISNEEEWNHQATRLMDYQKIMYSISDDADKYKDKPNILKVLTALTNPPLTDKWNAIGDSKAHLGFLLQTFLDEEEVYNLDLFLFASLISYVYDDTV